MSELREKLLEAYRSGNFLQTALEFTYDSKEGRASVHETLVSLHNEGSIDLIEQFESLRNTPDFGHNFFSTRHLLEKALPLLNAPVQHVMECVNHLAREAGEDMAANYIFSSFTDFCAAEPLRPAQVIKLIKEAPALWMDFIPPVIVAGTRIDKERYFEEAIDLSSLEDIEIRRRAIYSIGRIQYGDRCDLQEKALDYIEKLVVTETDDQLLANAIKSTCGIRLSDCSMVDKGKNIVDSALSKGGASSLHAAAEAFGLDTDNLPEPVLNGIILHLPNFNPQNKGTVRMIAFGVANLLKRDDPSMGIELLEALLIAHPEDLSLESLDSIAHAIHRSDNKLLNRLLTRWFLTGERALCAGITDVVNAVHGQVLHLEVDKDEIPQSDFVHLFFLARKAIGYLFLKPITTASIVISLMRQAKDDDTVKEIGNLLFSPLLLNYSGSLRDFLIQRSSTESGRTKDTIQAILDAFNSYLKDVRAVGNIPEMHPSQDQREAQSRYFQQEMSKSYKEAMKGSLISLLCSNSVILYGNKSIHYVQDPSGQSRRMEIPMTTHGTEVEVPRQEHIDPIGLDYTLRIFRVERMTKA